MTTTSIIAAGPASLSRDAAGRLLWHTMGLVALTAGLFTAGAYIGRDTSGGWTIVWFVVAPPLFTCRVLDQRSRSQCSGHWASRDCLDDVVNAASTHGLAVLPERRGDQVQGRCAPPRP
jgi:hypothetical protein